MDARDFITRLWVLMLTVFVDMIGFLIVLPLLPFYAERLGADAVSVGALVSIFAAAQLASAPLWGRLSDRYGRRPMILGGLMISAISYLLFESAATVGLLPVLFVLVPETRTTTVLGVPLPWLLLGLVVYPFLVLLGWGYVRRAEHNEQSFSDLVERR